MTLSPFRSPVHLNADEMGESPSWSQIAGMAALFLASALALGVMAVVI